jgi:acetoin utilization deacetylase AcuC-like enzyme
MATVGVVTDPIYLEHDPGSYHPESPERLRVLYELLEEEPGRMLRLHARRGSREEIGLVHSMDYFDYLASLSGQPRVALDPDTVMSGRSFEAALYAVGGVLNGIDALYEGTCDSVFALIRPPGHHASPDRGMGFCIFNNVAVGAAYAMSRHGCERVLIVDWDLHHGNGTQSAFYGDGRVLYFSTHQYPHYPGSGSVDETGTGEGAGFTVNVPLAVGAGDDEYREIFNRVLKPIALAYEPQLVLVSAGFDAHRRDPLGGMALTAEGYGTLTSIVRSIAAGAAGGRLLLALEGGYDLNGLRESVRTVLTRLSEGDDGLPGGETSPGPPVIERVLSVQRVYWPDL